jgi:hypothetical protein
MYLGKMNHATKHEYNTGFPHGIFEKTEDLDHNNYDDNAKGFPNTVTAVTAVTDDIHILTTNPLEHVNYNKNDSMPENLYRLYEKSDRWGRNNCTLKGDKWFMLQHKCKMNNTK